MAWISTFRIRKWSYPWNTDVWFLLDGVVIVRFLSIYDEKWTCVKSLCSRLSHTNNIIFMIFLWHLKHEGAIEILKSLSSCRADLKICIGGGDSGLMQVTLLLRFEEGGCIMTSLFIWLTKSSSLPRIMLKANLVPLPYLDFTPILPLKDLTMFSEITSPKPIP
mgnify:CR=1 FL=1